MATNVSNDAIIVSNANRLYRDSSSGGYAYASGNSGIITNNNINNSTTQGYVYRRSDKRNISIYKYKISMQYYNKNKNTTTDIKNESVKSVVIDHNYDINCMPIIYVNMKLDKSLVDDMIRNQNDNLIIFSVSRYDNNTEMKIDTLSFRNKFIYFLPDSVNKMDPVDYNDITDPTMKGDTFTALTLGLLCVDHINANKVLCELSVRDATMYDVVKYITSHMNNLIIEPFSYNDKFKQFILPPHDSVNKALKYLNNQKVFYSTPYRYYQDFDYTYIISSSGIAIERKDDMYNSIVINIRDIDDKDANTLGVITNRTSGTYEVLINYANTQVFDNTLINKSKTKIKGITSEGSTTIDLLNVSSYSKAKTQTIRINNDNDHMMENIEAKNNTENYLVYFSKNDLDTTLFSLNKRISIHNIERYQEFNGNYLLYRKREIYIREDTDFVMNSMINLKRIDT
jgi:hypothetical protein